MKRMGSCQGKQKEAFKKQKQAELQSYSKNIFYLAQSKIQLTIYRNILVECRELVSYEKNMSDPLGFISRIISSNLPIKLAANCFLYLMKIHPS